MNLGTDIISPEFRAELKTYYRSPLRKPRFELPDLFAKQRVSSNRWKAKLMSYILRFESNSWKIAQQKNPYISRSVTPPGLPKKDLQAMAKDIYSKMKLSESENNIKIIKEKLGARMKMEENNLDAEQKFFHKPFLHKQRKYKLFDPVKICETTRMKSPFSQQEKTERSLDIIKACEDFLTENGEEKQNIKSFLKKRESEKNNLIRRQKNYDESLFKEFVDINSEAVKKEENENELQRKKSFEALTKWMKGEGRLNKFLFMKYDNEVNGIKAYKRKHNLKKVAIDIRKMN